MSKHHPECPLLKHDNCRELDNPKLCAIVRKDKTCLKKQQRKVYAEFTETVKRIKDKDPELEAIVEREEQFNQNRPEKKPEDKINGKP
jgi:hypothetical protein